MNNYSNTSGFRSADWLVSAVKKHPEGLLLLAAGCALMLRTSSSSAGQRSRDYYSTDHDKQRMQMEHGAQRGTEWAMSKGVSRVADTAREYASDVGKSVSETADRYLSAAGEYAQEAGRSVMDQSGRIANQTQSLIERIVREQPLAVTIAGLAAGAAVAATFPSTQMERETLGVAGERLSEAASSAGERLTEAASAAGERLMTVAEERGLDADGLKKAARDVAGTFEKSLSGDRQDDDRRTGKQEGTTPLGAGSVRARAAGNSGQSSASGGGSSFGSKTPTGKP
jgi:hypothetical protein